MPKQQDLRTYRRREVTRESGYHTCEKTTGGECLIKKASRFICQKEREVFTFQRSALELVDLFEKGISLIAFGGYIHTSERAVISLDMSYCYEGQDYTIGEGVEQVIEGNSWGNVGFHAEQLINKDSSVIDVVVKMTITSQVGNILDFISFDFDVVDKDEFTDLSCAVSFYEKTYMHVPYLYYLKTDLPFDKYLLGNVNLTEGNRVVLKSCNRCGRFLPINIDDEIKTLSFSLHCKKRAPCIHSTFRAYEIQNRDELQPIDLKGLKLEGNKIVSYYGHQLECKACKKFL